MADKARFAADAVWAGVPGGRDAFAESDEQLTGDLTGGGLAYLRLAVRGDDEGAVGRAFSGAVVETSLSSYPGTFFTTAPSGAQGVARYWPTAVAAGAVAPHIECDGVVVPASPSGVAPGPVAPGPVARARPTRPDAAGGRSRYARSGPRAGAAVGPRRGTLGGQGR